jgi:hypothetical protein
MRITPSAIYLILFVSPISVICSTTTTKSADISFLRRDPVLIKPLKTGNTTQSLAARSPGFRDCSNDEERCGDFCLPSWYKCCNNQGGCAKDEECQRNDDGDYGCCDEDEDCTHDDGNFFHDLRDGIEDIGGDIKDGIHDTFDNGVASVRPGVVVIGLLATTVVISMMA